MDPSCDPEVRHEGRCRLTMFGKQVTRGEESHGEFPQGRPGMRMQRDLTGCERSSAPAHGSIAPRPTGSTLGTTWTCNAPWRRCPAGSGRPEGYVFSYPSRSHRFVFVDQVTEDIDPANPWQLG